MPKGGSGQGQFACRGRVPLFLVVAMISAWIVVLVIADLSYRYFENPMRVRLRDRYKGIGLTKDPTPA